MQDNSNVKQLRYGLLLPFRYNSSGKVIQFKLQTGGVDIALQADNRLKQLRKLTYKFVAITGVKKIGKVSEYFLVKEIADLDEVMASRNHNNNIFDLAS
jgi:hypothetical protein